MDHNYRSGNVYFHPKLYVLFFVVFFFKKHW